MEKKDTLIGLRKARTLLDTIVEMVEDDKYCIDIMQQNLAVIGLLKKANSRLLEHHLKNCFKKAVCSDGEDVKDKMIEEILKVVNLNNKI